MVLLSQTQELLGSCYYLVDNPIDTLVIKKLFENRTIITLRALTCITFNEAWPNFTKFDVIDCILTSIQNPMEDADIKIELLRIMSNMLINEGSQ
jgi:hypothetical protein